MQHKCNRKLTAKKGKKYPAHQIARKKNILMTRNHSKWLLSEKCSFTAESNAFVVANDGA